MLLTTMNNIPHELEQKYIRDAISAAADLGFELNVDKNCLVTIDAIALDLNSRLNSIYASRDPELLLSSIAIKNAAVIVSFLRKNDIDGDWFQDDETVGSNTYPYVLKDGYTIFPMAWVMKRILDGEKESIPEKFSSLKKALI